MNVRDFEYIIEIANQRSISKAATSLFVSQPALSKYVQRMEESLGVRLFQRVGKQFILTYAGERCVEKARQILSLHEQMLNEMRDISLSRAGRITLGVPMGRTDFFMSGIMPRFRKLYPQVAVTIYEGNTRRLLRQVHSGELAMALCNYNDTDLFSDEIRYDNLSPEEMVLAVPCGHALEQKAVPNPNSCFPFLDFELWKDEPFIMPSPVQLTRELIDRFFRQHGTAPNVVLNIGNLSQIFNAVRHGLGISITPSIMEARRESEQHRLSYFSIDAESPHKFHSAIATRRDRYLSVPEQALIQIFKDSQEE
ncbi:MAG: LysR family transcriptional regulator [Pyramidobacter sp.]|nr:LysR family transcriptional regulator [Pyramidobacter sp.]